MSHEIVIRRMRVVIKVGTSLIAPGGQIDANLLRAMVDQFDLQQERVPDRYFRRDRRRHVGTGIGEAAQRSSRNAGLRSGWAKQTDAYLRALFFGKKVVAQLLLSSDDFTSPVRYRNLQNALAELLSLGVVPIVNENDSVCVRELVGAFGDNDELSSLLATAVKADWLLLLTDVDGFLHARYGKSRKKPRLVRVVRKLTPALEAQCNGKSTLGRGGMISKLRAAKLASEAGVHVAIVNGRHPQGITLGMERKIGTYFPPSKGRN